MAIEYRRIGEKRKMRKIEKKIDEVAAQIERKNEKAPKIAKPANRKLPISIRFDPEILDYFEADGPGWQTRINAILLEHVRSRKGG